MRTPDECPPICAAVGHQHINAHVFRCDHDGRLVCWIDRFSQHGEEIEIHSRLELESGPFTADIDTASFLNAIAEALRALVSDPSTL